MYQVPSKLSDLWEFVRPGILESDVSSSVKALGPLGTRRFRQSSRISGNLRRSCDTARCTDSLFWWLSASNRLISAAKSCFTRNSPQSKHSKTHFVTLSSKISVSEDNEICFVQPVNKRVIAPGLRAQYSFKGSWKMHLQPQGAKFQDQSGRITAFIMKSKTFHAK